MLNGLLVKCVEKDVPVLVSVHSVPSGGDVRFTSF